MIRILIVDDHLLFREGLAAIIRSEPDIDVVGLAGSIRDATEAARAAQPDIILMDFGLPDGTGADATSQILKEFPSCKIIILTVSERDEDLFSAIRNGAKGYLLKGVSPADLVSAVCSVYQGESALSRSMTLRLMDEMVRGKDVITRPRDPKLAKLTSRELEVLYHLASGMTNLEIGKKLFLSENTVKYHVRLILDKLELNDRKQASHYAMENGLIKRD